MPSTYTLGSHFDEFVAHLVRSGRYTSVSEVMRDSLRLLEDRESKRLALSRAVEDGLNSGSPAPWDPDEIKQAGRRVLAASRAGNVDG